MPSSFIYVVLAVGQAPGRTEELWKKDAETGTPTTGKLFIQL